MRIYSISTNTHSVPTPSKTETGLQMYAIRNTGIHLPLPQVKALSSQAEHCVSISHPAPGYLLPSLCVCGQVATAPFFSSAPPSMGWRLYLGHIPLKVPRGQFLLSSLWGSGSLLGEAGQEDLPPPPLSTQLLKWGCHSGKSMALSQTPALESWLRDFA